MEVFKWKDRHHYPDGQLELWEYAYGVIPVVQNNAAPGGFQQHGGSNQLGVAHFISSIPKLNWILQMLWETVTGIMATSKVIRREVIFRGS